LCLLLATPAAAQSNVIHMARVVKASGAKID
jgi:hypothetical protein